MGDHPCELRLAEILVESADTLTDDFDPEVYLRRLSDHSVELLGAQGAGVMYTGGGGGVRLITGSRRPAAVRALLAAQHRGGPCLEGFGTGRPVPPVRIDSAEMASRWPAFAERAGEHGVTATLTVPLRHRGPVLGVLNVFVSRARGTEHAERELRLLRVLADAAAVGLHNHRTHARCRTLSAQLQGALDSRIRVEQAKGVLAERWNTGVDEAFEALRCYARRERRLIDVVAAQVVEGTLDVEELRQVRPGRS
ncbi:ANTAR domain-containing protein [Streptomyces sp. NPDC018059]|uniref:ANTAR domain-containing protein n=1 Tax=Streptomyces sp. NPDC018059 TaxID=3365041 RepID=UPI0037ADA536